MGAIVYYQAATATAQPSMVYHDLDVAITYRVIATVLGVGKPKRGLYALLL